MTPGEIIIDAVIRAAAIESATPAGNGGWIFMWAANAPEQIEAALAELGYTIESITKTKP